MLFRRLFPQLADRKWELVNLDQLARMDFPGPGRTKKVNPLNDPVRCYQWVDQVHGRLGVEYSYGGYLENRSHLWRGHYQEKLGRFIHLGVDYNVPEGTVVCAVRPLIVHAVNTDHDPEGGWGGQIIFKVPDSDLYVIYGHLAHKNLPAPGQRFGVGDSVGVVGDVDENGTWFPHLHIQCVVREPPADQDGYATPSADLGGRYPDPETSL